MEKGKASQAARSARTVRGHNGGQSTHGITQSTTSARNVWKNAMAHLMDKALAMHPAVHLVRRLIGMHAGTIGRSGNVCGQRDEGCLRSGIASAVYRRGCETGVSCDEDEACTWKGRCFHCRVNMKMLLGAGYQVLDRESFCRRDLVIIMDESESQWA
mmetsp:Transcript_21330/g.45066  ORF Transcript_21330/g.45066 Transcript_21330/m.45066 type:complete len:158 (-) Transcript_21330:119-592(-)